VSEIEKGEKVQALIKDLREQYSVHFTSEPFGDLEFQQLSLKEFSTVKSFSKETFDDRDFAVKLVFSLIVEPKLSIDLFQKIPDSELISIIRKICDKNETLKKFFGEPEDNLVFSGFREAVKGYNNEKVNELSKAISSIGISKYQILSEALPKIVLPKADLQQVLQQIVLPKADLQQVLQQIVLPKADLQQVLQQIVLPKVDLQQVLQQIVLPKVDLQQIVSQFVIPQMNIIQSWVQLNEDIFANFSKQFREFAESLKNWDLTTKNVDRILKKYKWFISLSLPASFYVKVLEIEETGVSKRKRINALFVDYFSKENYKALEELVEGWRHHPQFKPRMKIFRNCVKTLKRAKLWENPSIVVIPTLIPQIEGITNEIVEEYNVVQDPVTKKWIDGKGNQSAKKEEAKRKLIASLNEYSPLGEYLLLDVLFQEALRGKSLGIPTTFSRHKILHGECINYGRKDNTIRAFLILDFLHYLKST
jgi:hypothetical protein